MDSGLLHALSNAGFDSGFVFMFVFSIFEIFADDRFRLNFATFHNYAKHDQITYHSSPIRSIE
jgi:hypothetical protein